MDNICHCQSPEPALVEHGLYSLCEKCGQYIESAPPMRLPRCKHFHTLPPYTRCAECEIERLEPDAARYRWLLAHLSGTRIVVKTDVVRIDEMQSTYKMLWVPLKDEEGKDALSPFIDSQRHHESGR